MVKNTIHGKVSTIEMILVIIFWRGNYGNMKIISVHGQ